jgi:hypothetical protein
VPTLGVFFFVPLGFDSGMYLRYTTRKKDGKTHRYWRLLRSVRVGRRVIQRTVAQLGEQNTAPGARELVSAAAAKNRDKIIVS